MADALATAFVDIRPKSASFGPMLKRDLEGQANVARAAGVKTGESYASGIKAGLNKIGRDVALGTTAAFAAAGVAAVHMATNFQQAMERVHTQAGASQADVRVLSKEVLNLGMTTQQGPEQLAEALYHLKSVGLDNVAAMKALRVASDLAAVGGANLEDVTNAIGGAWRSGIKGAGDFAKAAATVNAIIGAGNMRMEDFVAAIGTGILPAAKTFGLSLQQVGAALALMTDEGIPATDAATRLRMSFSLLAAPSDHARGILSDIGIKGNMLANAMRSPGGLIAAISMLRDHLEKFGGTASNQATILSRAFGGGRSSSAIMTLLNNLDVLKMKQEQVNSTLGRYGSAVAAQRKTAGAQFALLRSQVEVLGVRIGTALLPRLTSVAKWMADNTPIVIRLGEAFAGLAVSITAVYLAVKTISIIGGISRLIRNVAGALTEYATAAGVASAVSAASAGGLSRMASATLALNTAMEGTAAASTSFAVGADGAAVAVGGLTTALLASPLAIAGAAAAVAGLTFVLLKFGGSITDVTDKMARQDNATGFNIEGYRKLARQTTATQYSQTQLGHAIRDSVPSFEAVRVGAAAYSTTLGAVHTVHQQAMSTADSLSASLGVLQGEFGLTQSQAIELASRAHVSAKALADTGAAGETAMKHVQAYGNANGEAAVKSILMADAQNTVSTALARVNDHLLTGQQNLLAWQQAQADATQALHDSTHGLHGNTDAAIAARAAILNSTQTALGFAESQSKTRDGVQKATSVIQDQIRWLHEHAGHSRFAAQEVDALRTALSKIRSETADIRVRASGTWHVIGGGQVIGPSPGGIRLHQAAGGLITMGTGPRADDVHAMVSRNEYIMQASAVDKYGVPMMNAINAGMFATGGLVAGGLSNAQPGTGVGRFLVSKDAETMRAIAVATAAATAAALKAAQSAASGGFGGISGGAGGGPNIAIGQRMAASIGWTGNEWLFLRSGWMEESGWRTNAQYPGTTPYTGAYGIPQSNPGSKMAAAGRDWLTNPVTQIRWGLGYIRSTYGSPTHVPLWSAGGPLPGYQGYAKGGPVSAGWYDHGGGLAPGWTLAYNGTGRTEHVVGPGMEDKMTRLLHAVETLPGRMVDALNGVAAREGARGYYSATG